MLAHADLVTSGPATQVACATGTLRERAHCVSVRCCANVVCALLEHAQRVAHAAKTHAAKALLERAHEQHAALKHCMSVRRCADEQACTTDGFWRGCAGHVVRTACSTGLSSDSCTGCSDLLP